MGRFKIDFEQIAEGTRRGAIDITGRFGDRVLKMKSPGHRFKFRCHSRSFVNET